MPLPSPSPHLLDGREAGGAGIDQCLEASGQEEKRQQHRRGNQLQAAEQRRPARRRHGRPGDESADQVAGPQRFRHAGGQSRECDPGDQHWRDPPEAGRSERHADHDLHHGERCRPAREAGPPEQPGQQHDGERDAKKADLGGQRMRLRRWFREPHRPAPTRPETSRPLPPKFDLDREPASEPVALRDH